MIGFGLGILFVAWLGLVAFLRRYRIWLLYYIVGTAGLSYWLVLVAREVLSLEPLLAHSVAWSVHELAQALGIPTRIFRGAPGVLLVLVVVQQVGWTVLRIGVESSGLLEMSVLLSLFLFYPGWSFGRRLEAILVGELLTWIANVVRILVIVLLLHGFGKQVLVLAHAYLGKALFFMATVAIYWALITRPTLRDLGQAYGALGEGGG